MLRCPYISFFFFFNDTATTEIYTLSLHDALPICVSTHAGQEAPAGVEDIPEEVPELGAEPLAHRRLEAPLDRKSTRLNSSHGYISYAVFCLKKKKKNKQDRTTSNNTDNA